MRKLILLILALVLALGAFPVAANVPIADLTELARYYPADTGVFLSFRTDEDFIDEMDELLDLIGQRVPITQGQTLRDLLDDFAAETVPDGDFDSVFGNWLGDTVAFGVVDVDRLIVDDPRADDEFLLVFEVLDRDAAETFADEVTIRDSSTQYEKIVEDNGAIRYLPAFQSDAMLLLVGNALLITNAGDAPARFDPDFGSALMSNDDFQNTLARLPEPDYNAVFYFDVSAMFDSTSQMIQESLAESGFGADMDVPAAFAAVGGQAIGLTVLDDLTLTVDLSFNIADPQAFEAATGEALDEPAPPVDFAFAGILPADTALVLQGTNLGPSILQSFDDIEALGDQLDEQFQTGFLDSDQQGLTLLDDLFTFVRLSFQGMSGLSLEEAYGWMTGDFLLYANLLINEDEEARIDLGNFVQVPEGAEDAAEVLVDGAANLFTELDIVFRVDEDNNRLILPQFGDLLDDEDVDVLLDRRGNLFAFGTRPTVMEAFRGQTLITATDTYRRASEYFLRHPNFMAYVNFEPLQDFARDLARGGNVNASLVFPVLRGFESASITVSQQDASTATLRLALTLAP